MLKCAIQKKLALSYITSLHYYGYITTLPSLHYYITSLYYYITCTTLLDYHHLYINITTSLHTVGDQERDGFLGQDGPGSYIMGVAGVVVSAVFPQQVGEVQVSIQPRGHALTLPYVVQLWRRRGPLYTQTPIHTHTHAHTHKHTYTHTYTHAHTHMLIQTHTHGQYSLRSIQCIRGGVELCGGLQCRMMLAPSIAVLRPLLCLGRVGVAETHTHSHTHSHTHTQSFLFKMFATV